MRYKLLILGIDGADWEVIDPLIQQDKLPFLAKIKTEGVYANLLSTIPSISAPAWASFQTGVSPAKHGIFDFEDIIYQKQVSRKATNAAVNRGPVLRQTSGSWKHKTGERKIVDSTSIKAEKFWDYLDQEGLRGCFINLPLTYPFPETKSLLISSLLTPQSAIYSNNKKVYNLLQKIGYIVDVDPLSKETSEEKSMAEREEKFKQVLRATRVRKEAALELMGKNFDVFFCLFRGSDILQHLFWEEEEIGHYYAQLDKALAEIYNRHNKLFKGNTLTFIISDHGFHKRASFKLHVVNWLIQEGYLPSKPKEPRTLTMLRPLYRPVKSFIEKGRLKEKMLKLKDIFWGKTLRRTSREYLQRSAVSAVHFGVYCPARQKQEIISKLKQLVYQGRKVFKTIYPSEEVYQGEYEQYLPDILFIPTEDFAIDPFPLREKVFTLNQSPLKGDHRSKREGIFLGLGKELTKDSIGDLNIEDLLPICLHILNLKIPQGLDGKVRKSIFRTDSQFAKRKIKIVSRRERIEQILNKELSQL